jgi:phosphoribosylformylglycinamidine (FGAM) synthase-like enzyme
MSVISESPFSPAEIASEGIKPEEYEDIVRRLNRHPNKAELGMFGVMSVSYTHLTLPTT